MLGSFGDDYEFDDDPPELSLPSLPQPVQGTVLPTSPVPVLAPAPPEPVAAAASEHVGAGAITSCDEFVLRVEASGPLGLKLVQSVTTGELLVGAVNLVGAAAVAEGGGQVRAGLVLRRVNNLVVAAAETTDHALSWIREAPRPLTLAFSTAAAVTTAPDGIDGGTGAGMAAVAQQRQQQQLPTQQQLGEFGVISVRFFEEGGGGGTVGLRFDRRTLAISGIAADGLASKHLALLAVGLRLAAAQGITVAPPPPPPTQQHPQYDEVVGTISAAAAGGRPLTLRFRPAAPAAAMILAAGLGRPEDGGADAGPVWLRVAAVGARLIPNGGAPYTAYVLRVSTSLGPADPAGLGVGAQQPDSSFEGACRALLHTRRSLCMRVVSAASQWLRLTGGTIAHSPFYLDLCPHCAVCCPCDMPAWLMLLLLLLLRAGAAVLKRFSDFEALHSQWVAPTMPRAAPLVLPAKSVSVTGLAASLAAGLGLTGGGGSGEPRKRSHYPHQNRSEQGSCAQLRGKLGTLLLAHH